MSAKTFKLSIPYADGSKANELEGVRRFQFTDPEGHVWEIIPCNQWQSGFTIRSTFGASIGAISEVANQIRIVAIEDDKLLGGKAGV